MSQTLALDEIRHWIRGFALTKKSNLFTVAGLPYQTLLTKPNILSHFLTDADHSFRLETNPLDY